MQHDDLPAPLAAALAEAAPMMAGRGWTPPLPAAVDEARRLLALVAPLARAPAVEVAPDGRILLEWEAAEHGWLRLAVDGTGRVAHDAVIGEDEFEQSESFAHDLPDWAATLLARLMRAGH
ncbi:MAG: hypothetical protein ACTHL8_19785 [Burkholderiaceae bacterium]